MPRTRKTPDEADAKAFLHSLEKCPSPGDAERVEFLRSLALLDTPFEPRFDRITSLAAATFNVPISLVSLVDADRMWFKSAVGLTGRFWFRKSWTGKLVLLVEEERPRWFGRHGETRRRWRDAKFLDFAEAPMRTLLTLERAYRVEHAAGPVRVLQTALPARAPGPIVPPPAPAP